MEELKLTEGCVVLEGGALKGMYTAGVLDVLMEHGIHLKGVVGVSAGAINGLGYAANQPYLMKDFIMKYRFDDRTLGMSAMMESKSAFGLEFVLKGDHEFVVDVDKISPQRNLIVMTTGFWDGKPHAFTRDNCSDILQAVRASSSMPGLSLPVEIDGKLYLDGGCYNNIALIPAYDAGYRKIMVIRTHIRSDREIYNDRYLPAMFGSMYRNYPEFADSLCQANKRYAKTCDVLEKLDALGEIVYMCPSRDLNVSRMEGSMDKLEDLYELGRTDCLTRLPQIRKYFGID